MIILVYSDQVFENANKGSSTNNNYDKRNSGSALMIWKLLIAHSTLIIV